MCKCLRKEELYDGKKFVALTFDDGPTPGITDQVLDVLCLLYTSDAADE